MFTTKPVVLIGLIGAGIQGSLAPELHMAEGERHGLRYQYRLIDTDRIGVGAEALPELIQAAERTGYSGLAITHPYKQAVMPHLTGLSKDAEAIDAVNTIVLKDGKRLGANTDWAGFAAAFRRNLSGAATGNVVLIGAGGAGFAVAYAMLSLGTARLTIFDAMGERAATLAARLNARFGAGRARAGDDLTASLTAADGVINATWTGMDGHPGTPVPFDFLRPELWVADIIYFPIETELLRHARNLGARAMNGGGMMAFQAVEQFRLFTGREADPEALLADFEKIRPRS
jgi:shikimate dehydrogenase